MDVRIGITHVTRELALEVDQSPDEVQATVDQALTGQATLLQLTDKKGRRILVPTANLAYVEIGEPEARRVGFNI